MVIITALTIIILFSISKYYDYKNPYVDEINEQGKYIRDGVTVGMWVRYKRTYSNGKVKFLEKKYD